MSPRDLKCAVLALLCAQQITRTVQGQECPESVSGDDVWLGDETHEEPRPVGERSYRLRRGRRASLLDGSAWLPEELCRSAHWIGQSAIQGEPPNCHQCMYDDAEGAAMLDAFLTQHGPALDSIFGDDRSGWARGCMLRRAYTIRLSRAFAPDGLHSDVPAGRCGEALADRPGTPLFLTVIAYPVAEWTADWGGHTEFVPRLCDEVATLPRPTSISLRVAPLPNRTLVFDGSVLHRATHPTARFAAERNAAASGDAWRRASIMQLTCARG